MKNILKDIENVFIELFDEETIARADGLDFASCEYWMTRSNDDMAKMSQEEYDDLKIWMDACMIFNFRYLRDERKRLVDSGAPNKEIEAHDDRTMNMIKDLMAILKDKPIKN